MDFMDKERKKKFSSEEIIARRKFWISIVISLIGISLLVFLFSKLVRSCKEENRVEEAWVSKHLEYKLGYAIPMSKSKKNGSTIREILEAQADNNGFNHRLNFAFLSEADSGMYIIRDKIYVKSFVFINKPDEKKPLLIIKGPEFAEERWEAGPPYVIGLKEYLKYHHMDDKIHVYMDLTKTNRYFQLKEEK